MISKVRKGLNGQYINILNKFNIYYDGMSPKVYISSMFTAFISSKKREG